MVKNEIKVEFSNSESLINIIEKSYFTDGVDGKIMGKSNVTTITESDGDTFNTLKGLHNATVKITNNDVIDGSMRFIIDESNDDLRIYPVSIYCIKESDKYIFY